MALLVALPLSVIFGMPHCQQLNDDTAVQECFQRAARGSTLYWTSIGVFGLASIALHLRRSRWIGAALVGLAFAPWLTVFIG